nr:hypothetical protein GCM10025732_27830 [Glycomyces mayteni]
MSTEPPRPTALITGAASGIGAALARLLAAQGHRLILVDREPLPPSSDCETIRADLTDPDDLAVVEDRCRSGLDLLVNNAGFGHPTRFLDTPIEAEIAMARLHMEAVLRLTHAALPRCWSAAAGEWSTPPPSSASSPAPPTPPRKHGSSTSPRRRRK